MVSTKPFVQFWQRYGPHYKYSPNVGLRADAIGRQAYRILDELEEDGAAHASI